MRRKKYETAPEILFEHKMRRKKYETAPEILFEHKIRRKKYEKAPEILSEHEMRGKYESAPRPDALELLLEAVEHVVPRV